MLLELVPALGSGTRKLKASSAACTSAAVVIPSPDAKGSQRIDEVITQRENQFQILCCCRQHRPSLHYLYSEMQKATNSHDIFFAVQSPPIATDRRRQIYTAICENLHLNSGVPHRPQSSWNKDGLWRNKPPRSILHWRCNNR